MRIDRSRGASRSQIRQIDRLAIERYGVPGLALMENAGAGAARVFLERFGDCARGLVLSGKGNNGGDGLVIARHIAYAGIEVRVLLLPAKKDMKGEAAVNLKIVERMNLRLAEARDRDAVERELRNIPSGTLVIDAIPGTGISGEVRGPARRASEIANESGRPVAAVDIPSGLDADAGVPLGAAIRAQATATFGLRKKGFENPGARQYTGDVEVIDIGWPPEAVEDVLGAEG